MPGGIVRLGLPLLALLLGLPAWAGTLAVLDFDSHVEDPAFAALGPGVADMMRTDLVRSGAVTLVERERLDAVLTELTLQRGEGFDPASVAAIGKLVGADSVVIGSVHQRAGRVRIDARIVDVATGVAQEARSVEGPATELFALEHALAVQLVGADAGRWEAITTGDLPALGDLLSALQRSWSDAPRAPRIERRPASPAPPPEGNVCRHVRVSTDPIDGDTRRETAFGGMKLSRRGDETVLTLRVSAMDGMRPDPTVADPVFHRGGSIAVELLLTDGTLLGLQSAGMPAPVAEIGGGLDITFPLTPEAVAVLASSGPALIRWHLQSGTADYEVSARDAEKRWRPAFACLLQQGG